MSSKEQGSYDGWNNVWGKQSEKEYLNPMYTEETPKTIFQFWQKGYANDLLEMIKDRSYKTFCELGSGRGTTSMYLSKNGYTDITMVDLAEEGFKVAEYSFQHYGLPLPKMKLANVEQTDFSANSFDCIYNIGLLEHFEDPSKTLKEAYRLLTQGGLIFMPIVPELPFSKAMSLRLKYNPISVVKYYVKAVLGKNKKQNETGILRTTYNKAYYEKITKELGYKNVKCLAYNPYWKVTETGSTAEDKMLNEYISHYNENKEKQNPSLLTTDKKELCYLLIGEK